MFVTVNSQENMLARGMDPKPLILDFCKPQCTYWKEKLERCEAKLEIVIKTNPTKSCIYPMRDWATCVEACVSSKHSDVTKLIGFIGSTHGAQPVSRNGTWVEPCLMSTFSSNIIGGLLGVPVSWYSPVTREAARVIQLSIQCRTAKYEPCI